MRIHLPKKHLADVLGHIERIVPARSSTPGLNLVHMALSTETDVSSQWQVSFQGSNMDMDIEAVLNVTTEDGASPLNGTLHVAVPAHMFGQIVRVLPGELVELEFSDQEVKISSGSFATSLQQADASGVPELQFPETYDGLVSAATLTAALGHVRYAAAVAEYQAIFRGVKLELRDGHSRAIATDGFRLAYYHTESSSGLSTDAVIPAKGVDEIGKLLGDGDVRVHLADSQVSLATGHYRLNVKLMEGTFPDYERVIPADFVVSMTVDGKQLSDTVRRVALMADQNANNRVDLFLNDGTLQITAEGGYGRSQEALTVAQEGSESQIALAYNANYLVDALAPVSGDMRVSFSGTTSPSLLSSLQDPSYLAMVVPLRTS
ncbi:MAG: DNA polymerase III subunit beta [Deinococcota bacterium]